MRFCGRQPGRKAADSEQRIRPTTTHHAQTSGRRADSLFRIRRFSARLAPKIQRRPLFLSSGGGPKAKGALPRV